ncbi:MAG: DNA-binding protein [Candidatus Aenigmarchaeota archaeon]|nr:DNA-binding protein [Candidatus Aenigmarchaeota archaeon]
MGKIAELSNGSRKVEVEGKVVQKEQPREVSTKFGRKKVCNAIIEDDSGSIMLVLWGDEIDNINEGDTVKIENGYVSEWKDTLQLSVGQYGKMTVL